MPCVLLRDLLHHRKPRIGGLCDLLVLLASFMGKRNLIVTDTNVLSLCHIEHSGWILQYNLYRHARQHTYNQRQTTSNLQLGLKVKESTPFHGIKISYMYKRV